MEFDKALEKLLKHEGGYVNHPDDPGGETNYGITLRVARENGYQGSIKDIPMDVVKRIYKTQYWDKVRANELPDGVRFAMFDYAVNSGVVASIRMLQKVLGVTADGVIGPATLAAVGQWDGHRLACKLNGARLEFMTTLKTWPSFGRGWAARIAKNLQEL